MAVRAEAGEQFTTIVDCPEGAPLPDSAGPAPDPLNDFGVDVLESPAVTTDQPAPEAHDTEDGTVALEDLSEDLKEEVSLLALALGITVLAATALLMARGGGRKQAVMNLIAQGKANQKKPMTDEQKKIRRSKRKKK